MRVSQEAAWAMGVRSHLKTVLELEDPLPRGPPWSLAGASVPPHRDPSRAAGCPYGMSAGFPQHDNPREETMVPKISLDREIKTTSHIYDNQ